MVNKDFYKYYKTNILFLNTMVVLITARKMQNPYR